MILDGLEPQRVFSFFERLSSVPHGSGNTEKISSLCQKIAEEYKIPCVRDQIGNIIMKVPASGGAKDAAPVILQGHLDMVCDKAPDCTKNMAEEGLDLKQDGSYVWADGTSLGGDDGIAIAMALAVITDPTLKHPPIEAVFTVNEETGMDGAHFIDLTPLESATLLNIDSEVEGTFTCGCAGGIRANVSFGRKDLLPANQCLEVRLSGFTGGHSGIEINKGRANAILTLGRILKEAFSKEKFALVSLYGGTAENVIPTESRAVLSCTDGKAVSEAVTNCFSAMKGELKMADPDADIRFLKVPDLRDASFNEAETNQILSFLAASPFGVQAMCAENPFLVETSLNLGVARTDKDKLEFCYSVRSSVNSKKKYIMEKITALAELAGGKIQFHASYSPWEFREYSPIREQMTEVYKELFGTSPEINVIHAGLECGLFCEKKPEMDCISFGPNLLNIHTYHEKMDIASVARVWKMLTTVLERLAS